MNEEISGQIVDQRMRNRMMEAIEILADGPDGVRAVGAKDFFGWFYFFLDPEGQPNPNSAMNDAEFVALRRLIPVVDQAYDKTPYTQTDDDLIASAWPDKIAPEAARVLAVFNERGLSNEEMEEADPSGAPL